jgi:hypothetical protein
MANRKKGQEVGLRFSLLLPQGQLDALDSVARSMEAGQPGLKLDRCKMIRMAIAEFVEGR